MLGCQIGVAVPLHDLQNHHCQNHHLHHLHNLHHPHHHHHDYQIGVPLHNLQDHHFQNHHCRQHRHHHQTHVRHDYHNHQNRVHRHLRIVNVSVSDPSPKPWSPIFQKIRLCIFGSLSVPKPGDDDDYDEDDDDAYDEDDYDDGDDGDDDEVPPSHGLSCCDNMHPTKIDLEPFAPIFSCRWC